MNTIELISKRKSIRKFETSKLDAQTYQNIETHIQHLKTLNSNIKTELKLVSGNNVKGLLSKEAPYFIIAFSEVKEGYMTNIGYMLQQMQLYLMSLGLGSCYQGSAKPTKEILAGTDLEFVIVLSFGKPVGNLYRENKSEFKRKAYNKITNIRNEEKLFELVRLAPSAMNSQPWYFTGNRELVHAYCALPKGLMKAMYEKMNPIDMGIGLYHLQLALENDGDNVQFVIDEKGKSSPPDEYYYVGSLKKA